LDQFSEVVKRCKDAGMNVEAELDAVGIVTGSIDSSKIHSLDQIEGVEYVEQSRNFQIAPPDSPIQ
jgi:fructose/tagatose bisphosphate aldolase